MKKQAGFTLMELLAVIVLLGILSAVAVPRYYDMGSKARTNSILQLEGSIRSASALVYALSQANGTAGSDDSSVTAEGTTIDTKYGYPQTTHIDDALNSYSGFAFSSGTFTISGYSGSNCQVAYTEAASAGASPTIAATTSGC